MNAMVTQASVAQDPGDVEQRVVVHGVSYSQYVAIRELLEERHVRVAFCEGVLEIMSPSTVHEFRKKTIGRLVELYATMRGIALHAYGSATFRAEAKQRGVEPDECYFVGRNLDALSRPFPDIVIEVIVTSAGIDKLSIYDGLGVPEVWIFWLDQHGVFVRKPQGGYERGTRSRLLPELDLARLAAYAATNDQFAAVQDFLAHLRGA
jgi:Uma2 family endonuclease